MESQVQRYGYQRLEANEGTRRRKPAAEADVCRFEPGTPGAQGYCAKKAIKPDKHRALAVYALGEHGLSERQACKILKLSRSVFRYQPKRPYDTEIEQELLGLAARKPSWGFGRMLAYMKSDSHDWNHKRIRRVYCELRLNLRVKPRKRLPKRPNTPRRV